MKHTTHNTKINPERRRRMFYAPDLSKSEAIGYKSQSSRISCFMFHERGFGIIEIIVAVSIISIALFAISEVSVVYLKQNTQNKKSLKASYLAEEALEAARSVRDQDWTANIASLTMGSTYYPVISSNKWTLTATNPGLIDGVYTRIVVFENVSRDTNDDIITSGGTDDPDTKKVTATILWESKSTTLTTYLTNLYNN